MKDAAASGLPAAMLRIARRVIQVSFRHDIEGCGPGEMLAAYESLLGPQ